MVDDRNKTEKRNYKNFISENKKSIYISLAIIITIITVGFIYIFSVKSEVESWQNKIYPNVTVHGVDIGGLTKEEANLKLKEELSSPIMDKILKVVVDDKEIDLKYSEVNPVYDVESITNEAFSLGKEGSLFEKKKLISKGINKELDAKITYDENELKKFEEKVKSEVNVNAKDATISINGGNISVDAEVAGKKINDDELHKKLVESINGNPSEEIQLKFTLEESQAKVKESDLKKITGKISFFTTSYTDTGDGRVTNMNIALKAVNGTVLMPGEEFSYNNLVGDTTPDKGYQKANTYIGNEIVPDYGGGICQVSTTLYRAVMGANLRSTERANHSLTVSYSEPGLDATVAYGVVDYKFVNTYDFPVYIEGYISDGTIGFNIYGNKEALGGKTYKLVNEVVEKYEPQVKYEDNPSLKEGEQRVKVNGMPGYKANSYQITYENGVEVKKEKISTDVYKTTDTIIERGTKKE
ncbi:MAG: VanW family protein [Clostridium septicum]|uniref:VanW family protein n=1 Tax=Clostridium septicum TaxID=1504 RepID=UPI0025829379|nr:VanW family protein [Clostridium septicum]MDU1313745.1 VanW family protein [Clostridium septicum]